MRDTGHGALPPRPRAEVFATARDHHDERLREPGRATLLIVTVVVDSRVDPLLRGSTCYYEAPDGRRLHREAAGPFENPELLERIPTTFHG